MAERLVIVGGGQAGGVAAASVREGGFDGEIVLVGEEARPPYQRPPLSKNFLAGQMDPAQLLLRPEAFYRDKRIELVLGTRVEALERSGGRVRLSRGAPIEYSTLLLATGSRPRRLQIPGTDLPGVHYLRTAADVERIRADMAPGRRMVIIGGGYIGLEVAAVAVQCGLRVALLEGAERILGRVTGKTIADFFAAEHRSRGVDLRCGVRIDAITGTSRVEAVSCADGSVPADLVVVGVGVLPNVELAASAGLECDNGIVVDDHARTADPCIYAAGDCTNHPNALLGRRLRLESVQNALDQARTAASNICGRQRVYAELPWFWSNQYDLRLQMAGLSQGHDRALVRGDPQSRSFSVLYLGSGKLIAADTVNAPKDHLALRKLIAQGGVADLARLTDPSVPLA